jgi:GDSL-like Lipase/Acylhydrolase family
VRRPDAQAEAEGREDRDVGVQHVRLRRRTIVRCLHWAANIALVAAVAALTYVQLPRSPVPVTSPPAHLYGWNPDRLQPTLLVIGDSYAAGQYDPTVTTYPIRVGEQMGWNVVTDASGGTGYLREVTEGLKPGEPVHQALPRRLDGDKVIPHVDYIIIDAGRNDYGLPTSELGSTADDYITKVHSMWPNATTVVMYPSFATGDMASQYPEFAAVLSQAASDVGAYVIDPVGQGWYRDIDLAPLLWKDHVHLNNNGQFYYAGKIVENLKHWFKPWTLLS